MKKLFPFQEEAVRFLISRKRALLASDAGTGKTVVLVEAVNRLALGDRPLSEAEPLAEKPPLDVLVLCPKSVKVNWEREIEVWSRAPHVRYTVTNWDTLVTRKKEALNRPWDVLVADESHMALKNPKAKRGCYFLETLVPKASYVWLATATPASTSALDYYCTLKVLLPSLMAGFSTRQFQKRYCEEKYCPFTPGGRKYVGFKNTEDLKVVFSKTAIRHKKEKVLPELPKVLFTDLCVDVDPRTVAENLNVDADTVRRCIEEGRPLPGHIAHVLQANAHAKLDDAAEWVSNFPENEALVVFAWHQSVIHALKEKITGSEVITGETDIKKRQNIIDSFSAGELKRIICNMQAGGVGLNLQKARTALYIEFPFSPSFWIQSLNRVHRIGSTGVHVHIVRMMGRRTIDEVVWQVLDSRMKDIEKVGV